MTANHRHPSSADAAPAARREADLRTLEHRLIALIRKGRHPRLHEHLAEVSGVPLEQALYTVLGRVGDLGPLRLSALADSLDVDASTVSRQAGRLLDAGLLSRQTDPDDKRALLLTITDDGRQVLLQRRAAWHAVLGTLLERWSDEDVRDFASFLDRFVEQMAGLIQREPSDSPVPDDAG